MRAVKDSDLNEWPNVWNEMKWIDLLKSTFGRPDSLQVPQIVQTCVQYLQQNGLSVIGLFRVAGSVKRCRQLKVDLESGGELFIRTDDEEGLEHYPHDIATLLKEFFRDLPQPLLTSELYPAFLEVTSKTIWWTERKLTFPINFSCSDQKQKCPFPFWLLPFNSLSPKSFSSILTSFYQAHNNHFF